MSAKDRPVSMPSTDAYRDGWDRLWGGPMPPCEHCGKAPRLKRASVCFGCADTPGVSYTIYPR